MILIFLISLFSLGSGVYFSTVDNAPMTAIWLLYSLTTLSCFMYHRDAQ
jgi:hypothetical protein